MSNELKHEHIANLEIPLGFTIFCDMDGTLVDSDYANFLSYKRALIDVNTNCGIFDIKFTNERLNRESLKELAPSLTTTQLETIVALKEEYFMGFISETRLNTELANLVKGCCQKYRLILVTGCRGKRALEILKHYNMQNYFTRLICWEDTNQSGSSNKYESAIKLTGAIPDYIFIFEDDDICIEDAVRAGVPRKNIKKIFIESRDCDESI